MLVWPPFLELTGTVAGMHELELTAVSSRPAKAKEETTL
jgi:hypothetical protein